MVGWYTNRDYIEKFDFETAVTSDLTLYALWTQDGATYHDVTFDYDFYGARITEYSYPVIEGGKVAKPSADPERYGYVFAGWYDTSGVEFDFDGAITADNHSSSNSMMLTFLISFSALRFSPIFVANRSVSGCGPNTLSDEPRATILSRGCRVRICSR